ncbi:MAG TPA: 3-oxoacid CoA-transferase subunit A [Halanaerobiales bacterium]|nr:3-oxoacid CoA-transferase subunit A [Halanaerobiales bacterium]
MQKVVELQDLDGLFKDNMTLMIGGFLNCGTAETVLEYLNDFDLKNLNIIVNDAGFNYKSKGKFLANTDIKKMITSHIGTNPDIGKKMNSGEIDIDLIPQGNLVEQIRCEGAGLGGVLTPIGIGTKAEEGKEVMEVDGEKYILAKPLAADIAIIKAWKADESGNLIYRYSARNFNPIMAMAADTVIVEAEQVVKNGELNNNNIETSNIFVDYVIESDKQLL